jgi:hypothetical protein
VFAVTWLGVWLLTTFLWPMKEDLQSLGAPPPPTRRFDPWPRRGAPGGMIERR